MNIFVLSLVSSKERREKVVSTMREYGLDFEFIDGVDGRVDQHPFLERYNEQNFIYNYRRPAALGELGCYASHMLGWEKCVSLDKPIIIFEDDFILNEHSIEAFQVAEELIEKYGFIRLETTRKKPTFKVARTNGFTLHHFLKVPQCLTCYMISPKVAKALLDSSLEIIQPVDVLTRNVWMHKQPIYGLTPYTVQAGGHESIIGKRQKMPKKDVATHLMCNFTRLKNRVMNLIQQLLFLTK